MLVASTAFIFVPLLAFTMIFGGAIFAYASHCFVTVVEQTASGNDEVAWPNDPIFDWLWQAVYMCWLTAIWLGPIFLILRAAEASRDPAAPWAMIGAAVAVWLLFPLTLLSSMSGGSRWTLISPPMLRRLFGQRGGSLLTFYGCSAPVLAVGAACFYFAFLGLTNFLIVGLSAFGLAFALMIYARQLGRLAHLVEHTRDPVERPARTPVRRTRVRAARDPWSDDQPRQPRDMPPVNAPAEEARVGYDVRYDDGPAREQLPPPPQPRPPDLDDVPYELQGSATAEPRMPLPQNLREPSEYEMALAIGGRTPPPPDNPWTIGVFNFPFYQRTLPPTAALCAGVGFLALVVHVLNALKP